MNFPLSQSTNQSAGAHSAPAPFLSPEIQKAHERLLLQLHETELAVFRGRRLAREYSAMAGKHRSLKRQYLKVARKLKANEDGLQFLREAFLLMELEAQSGRVNPVCERVRAFLFPDEFQVPDDSDGASGEVTA